mmetsp:Transcript_43331/g.70892  ORF Transcript_43331/g.70892 Transcript_43331/m.70892 type:complete len:237 (-) Transcript_43331:278-988(-)
MPVCTSSVALCSSLPLPGRRPTTSWFLPLLPGTMPSHWGHTSGCEGSGPSTRPPRLALRRSAPSGQLRAAPRRRRRWRGPSRSRGGPRQRRAAPTPLVTPSMLPQLHEGHPLGCPAVLLHTHFLRRQNLTHLRGIIVTCLVTITMDAHSSLADLICCLLLRSSIAHTCKVTWLGAYPAFQHPPSLRALGLQEPSLPTTNQAFQLALLYSILRGDLRCHSVQFQNFGSELLSAQQPF